MFLPEPAASGADAQQVRVLSIGHSNHSLERFLELLAAQQIKAVADVRSAPWSKYVAWANQPVLRKEFKNREIEYVFLGQELGGKPTGDEYEGVEDRRDLYRRIEKSTSFQEGIDRLIRGASRYRIAMLCSEENPYVCHRHLLITPALKERDVAVHHIRGNGAVEMALVPDDMAPHQLTLL